MKYSSLSLLLGGLLLVGCQMTPPKEPGTFREVDLVELTTLDASLRLDIRYATTNNFLQRPVYLEARAFLQRPAAEALLRANRSLRSQGYGLLIFDGYRPWAATKVFWDHVSAHERKIGFVADPRKGSKHNRGCAVDLTLFEVATGKEIAMPSAYDEFTERAFVSYTGGSAESRALRDKLRVAMEAEGFEVNEKEWWHFNYRGWQQYRILNVAFDQIEKVR